MYNREEVSADATQMMIETTWMLPITAAASPPNSSFASRVVAKIVDATRTPFPCVWRLVTRPQPSRRGTECSA